jgi:ligand-binding SRPBCC domain-containing protein
MEFAFPVERVFAVLSIPAQRVALTPPEMQLRLISGPRLLAVGVCMTVESRRLGLAQRIISEIVELETNALIVEQHQDGPFAFWQHTQKFTALPEGRMRLEDRIEYELPGGLLGMFLTCEMVEREMVAGLRHRNRVLGELLSRKTG